MLRSFKLSEINRIVKFCSFICLFIASILSSFISYGFSLLLF